LARLCDNSHSIDPCSNNNSNKEEKEKKKETINITSSSFFLFILIVFFVFITAPIIFIIHFSLFLTDRIVAFSTLIITIVRFVSGAFLSLFSTRSSTYDRKQRVGIDVDHKHSIHVWTRRNTRDECIIWRKARIEINFFNK